MIKNRAGGSYDLMWDAACSAPHRYASGTDIRFVVILDEFQYFADFVYRNEACEGQPIRELPGSFHSLSESKVAPMLVTGSYIGILMKIIHKHFEGGRLAITRFEPYLTPEEGLLAVYKYAEVYRKTITNQTAQQINELCLSDPFFISQVILSDFKGKDLSTSEGVINAVNFEITNRHSMMSGTWAEYLYLTFKRVNGIHTKSMMLFLNKFANQYWTVREIKEKLKLELSEDEVYQRLVLLAESDVIERGTSDIDFRLSDYFSGGSDDRPFNVIEVHERVPFQRPDSKGEEIDVIAKTDDGRVLDGRGAQTAREDRTQNRARFT